MASPVICGWSACDSAPRNVTVTFAVLTGPPVATALPAPTLLSPCTADWICAAVELNGSGAVVWPLNVSVNVPPVASLTRTVCDSSVLESLNGEKPPELPPPDGLSSPVTSQRLLCLSKSMSPAT